MDLCLIRHAAADARAGLSDGERPLSERGRADFELAVRGLGRLGLGFDRVLFSPLARAVQTAELLAPLVAGESAAAEELAREPSPELLARLTGGRRIALVGHEPWLGGLASWLVIGERELAAAFSLPKGGLALLRGEPRPGRMALEAFLSPDLLRRLGEMT